jgi:AcrR family transcriptional regulator
MATIGDEHRPARERILDAAVVVLREQGIAHATTKEIARSAGCSEALLYKHFPTKQVIFTSVLQERLQSVDQLMTFYAQSFPIAASIFGSASLLRSFREGIRKAGGGGPEVPVDLLTEYLVAEQRAGRLEDGVDPSTLAVLLVGAAFQQGAFAAFDGRDSVIGSQDLACRLVDTAYHPANG